MRFEDSKLRQVVQYAAILYPGPSWSYGNGIEALQALPGSEVLLEERLRAIFWMLCKLDAAR